MTKQVALQTEKAKTIRGWLKEDETITQLKDALPGYVSGDRFLRIFYTAILQNTALLDCSKASLLSALIQAGQLGLEPIMGKAALIPYGNQCQFQPMYRGLIDLARNTGGVKVTAHVVYEKDKFKRRYGLSENLIHEPAEGDRGDTRGAYTVWTWVDSGAQSFTYMSKKEIEEIRDKYSKSWKRSGKTSIWGTAPGEMWKKTVIIRHSKLEPCSPEMEQAARMDGVSMQSKTIDIAQLPELNWSSKISTSSQEKSLDVDELFKTEFIHHKHATTITKITEGVAALAEKFKVTEEEIKRTALDDPEAFRAEIKGLETTAPTIPTSDPVNEMSAPQNEEEAPPPGGDNLPSEFGEGPEFMGDDEKLKIEAGDLMTSLSNTASEELGEMVANLRKGFLDKFPKDIQGEILAHCNRLLMAVEKKSDKQPEDNPAKVKGLIRYLDQCEDKAGALEQIKKDSFENMSKSDQDQVIKYAKES